MLDLQSGHRQCVLLGSLVAARRVSAASVWTARLRAAWSLAATAQPTTNLHLCYYLVVSAGTVPKSKLF